MQSKNQDKFLKYQIKTGSVRTGLSQTVSAPARSRVALLRMSMARRTRIDDVVVAFGVDDLFALDGTVDQAGHAT